MEGSLWKIWEKVQLSVGVLQSMEKPSSKLGRDDAETPGDRQSSPQQQP